MRTELRLLRVEVLRGKRALGYVIRHLAVAAALANPLAVAEGFWHDRGVRVSASPVVRVGALPAGVVASVNGLRGDVITIDRRLLESSRRYQCTILAHELGHTGGLEHTVGGIMDGTNPETPWACRKAFR